MPFRLKAPLVLLIVLGALAGGIWAGGHPDVLPGFARDALVGDSEAQVYQEALDKIGSDYYRTVDTRKLVDASLDAAVDSLKDRFSQYIDPKEYRAFEQNQRGEFEGVGLNVREHTRGLMVVGLFRGGPAEKAGIEKGDLIVAVDGKSLRGRTSTESTDLIKGPAGTAVTLTVVREGNRRELRLQRAAVSVPVSRGTMRTSGGHEVAHVALAQFTSGAHGEVSTTVRRLLKAGAEGVVLDLRSNGGGLLQEGVLVASLFVPEGPIVTTRGRSQPSRTYDASGRSIDTDLPVVVLVDGGTASASEIVTGALQDRDRATVVGTRTFGKGVFQQIEDLSNGGALDITVGEYFTPKGRNLGPRDGKPGGIEPDVRAEDDPDTKPDEALRKALEVVTGKL